MLIESKSNPLTVSEEVLLLTKIKSGDTEALERLIEINKNLIIKIAKKYSYKQHDLQDNIQEGLIGFLEAVNRFEPSKNVRFTTYAYHWIRKEISMKVNQNDLIRLPINLKHDAYKIKKASEEMEAEGAKATVETISERINLKEDSVTTILRAMYNQPVLGNITDEKSKDDENSKSIWWRKVIADNTEDGRVESNLEKNDLKNKLDILMERVLSEREKTVIKLRFGLNGEDIKECTHRNIEEKTGIKRRSALYTEKAALKKLRQTPEIEELKVFLNNG